MGHRVLLVDDDVNMCEMLAQRLSKRGFEPTTRTSAAAALELLEGQDFDAMVTDMQMPGMTGIELCERVLASRPNLPVIVVTAFGSMETAVSAIRAGAYDFITKPFEIDILVFSLERAIGHRSLLEEVTRLRAAVIEHARFHQIIGESGEMRKVFDLVRRVADSDASALVCGESGSGKELVARALHEGGRRKDGPFVAINCAAMPETLLESELFGYEKGAFTDAKAARQGLFVQADGGTLLLDEIGDMPLSLQPKLLRALEERTARPVGGKREVPFDVRLIVATNRDLEGLVGDDRFREDLYFRINVVRIDLPPLRSRGRDVLLLAQHFLDLYSSRSSKEISGFASPAAERLLAYTWPGNVRELKNCIEGAVTLARHDKITVDDLPEKIRAFKSTHVLVAGSSPDELVSMEEVEKRYIARVLEAVGGSRTSAARILGLDRKTLYRKIRSYGLESRTEGSG